MPSRPNTSICSWPGFPAGLTRPDAGWDASSGAPGFHLLQRGDDLRRAVRALAH